MVIKKDPTKSIRKHTNVLKVHEKTVRTAIKQDLSSDFNSFDYCHVISHWEEGDKITTPRG